MCAIPAPQQLDAIPWNSAKPSHNQDARPGTALFDQLLSLGESGIVEVALEKSPASKTYPAKLEAVLAQLLLWVSTTVWATVDWMLDATKCNQVLCEYVQKMHKSSGNISAGLLAILAIQNVRRVEGPVGPLLGLHSLMATSMPAQESGADARGSRPRLLCLCSG